MPFKSSFKILLPVGLLLLLLVQCVIVFLPDISRHIIRSSLGPLPGNVPVDFMVSRLGVTDTQIRDISFGGYETVHFSDEPKNNTWWGYW